MQVLFIIVGLAALAAGIIIFNVTDREKRWPFLLMSALGLIIMVLGLCIVSVPTGYTGIRSTFGQIQNEPLSNGINFRIPLVQRIEKVNNKQQDGFVRSEIWGETEEKVQVYMSNISITYQINPEASAWIVANVNDYENSLITTQLVSSALKNSVATLPAEKATIRSEVEPIAEANLQKILDDKYGEGVIDIHKIVIADMNFEDSYNQSISQRNQAELIQQRQAIENQTAIEKAEADKKVQVTAAEAKAQVMLTEAEAEKKANELREASLTGRILVSRFIERWNGELPKVQGADGMMLGIDSLLAGEN